MHFRQTNAVPEDSFSDAVMHNQKERGPHLPKNAGQSWSRTDFRPRSRNESAGPIAARERWGQIFDCGRRPAATAARVGTPVGGRHTSLGAHAGTGSRAPRHLHGWRGRSAFRGGLQSAQTPATVRAARVIPLRWSVGLSQRVSGEPRESPQKPFLKGIKSIQSLQLTAESSRPSSDSVTDRSEPWYQWYHPRATLLRHLRS
jgi:hypothetical protein